MWIMEIEKSLCSICSSKGIEYFLVDQEDHTLDDHHVERLQLKKFQGTRRHIIYKRCACVICVCVLKFDKMYYYYYQNDDDDTC